MLKRWPAHAPGVALVVMRSGRTSIGIRGSRLRRACSALPSRPQVLGRAGPAEDVDDACGGGDAGERGDEGEKQPESVQEIAPVHQQSREVDGEGEVMGTNTNPIQSMAVTQSRNSEARWFLAVCSAMRAERSAT